MSEQQFNFRGTFNELAQANTILIKLFDLNRSNKRDLNLRAQRRVQCDCTAANPHVKRTFFMHFFDIQSSLFMHPCSFVCCFFLLLLFRHQHHQPSHIFCAYFAQNEFGVIVLTAKDFEPWKLSGQHFNCMFHRQQFNSHGACKHIRCTGMSGYALMVFHGVN